MDYFENELLPGVRMFRCGRLSACISDASCAGMWVAANVTVGHGRSNDACKACSVGAGHAGHSDPSYHWLRGTGACARCQRTDLRLICGYVCVACKNREYEWIKGKNAKGKPPIKCKPLVSRVVFTQQLGVTKIVERPLTASVVELVVQQLRDESTRVLFGWGKGRVFRYV